MHFSNILANLALAGSVLAAPYSRRNCTNSTDESLYKAMLEAGKTFLGTASALQNETTEAKIINQNFNSITPENAMKFDQIEPSRGNFTWTEADRYAQFAKQNNVQIHCHNLVWYERVPQWVTDGKFDNHTLIGIMEDHIKAIVTRYKGVCARWDVVNEALNENGTYRDSIWYNTIGEAYIPIAFSLARKYDSEAKLFYNDYDLEFNGQKTEGAKRIVKLIKSYGVDIDGVGFQAHLSSYGIQGAPGPAPTQDRLETVLKTVADEGVDVAFTEIDLRIILPVTSDKLTTQSSAFQRIAAACASVKQCIGMTTWGISDRYTWITELHPDQGAPLLWDANYNKKPAYAGFLRGITTGQSS